ncbi:hypothetical protein HYQ46_002178 [Verticillium longisporum]|uniref:BRCT domain-containing protein n=2 Tax=Verticillium TaxID=1036719 RepID=G2X4W5_VERDV|nr:predicted protein [Verticillium alfalfae VaMs.102]XP_009653228.1 uncharacterized protein VDAG_05197 [Verticillium dahliae VdLs.17]KAG7102885.1 hypothetical protein HYQ44_016973 [Verticillium longisporum]EEY23999.1 predicted protein [Verticillium alfalfae VaMs.102]EGY23759.1 hypothetical protein VDAG_05197 [Verticillium dahliae VdLs.17]KAG7152965.1 hypothetical protein HYQ46_002178 [Verticillium longisporum]
MFPTPNIAVSCPLPDGISLQEVKTWIYKLGGSYHERVYETTDVLCSTYHRIRYLHKDAFRATQLKAAIVPFEWLHDSYKRGKFLPVSRHLMHARQDPKCAPLRGCVIAFTSSFPLPKGGESYDSVRNAIVRLGGTHRADVRPDVLTHFCVTEKELDRFDSLVEHVVTHVQRPDREPLWIVSHQWLTKCLEQHERAEESRFTFPRYRYSRGINGTASEDSPNDVESEEST